MNTYILAQVVEKIKRKRTRPPHVDIVDRAKTCQVDLPWWKMLAIGTVVRACLDYRLLNIRNAKCRCINGDYVYKDELEKFFGSQWCDMLLCGTSIDGNFIKWASNNLF